MSIFVAGRKVHILDAKDMRPQDSAPSAICFNSVSLTLASAHQNQVSAGQFLVRFTLARSHAALHRFASGTH